MEPGAILVLFTVIFQAPYENAWHIVDIYWYQDLNLGTCTCQAGAVLQSSLHSWPLP